MPRSISCLSIVAALASCSANNGGSPAPGTVRALHAPSCAPDEFLYDDESCGTPTSSNPTPSCTQRGDGWCHAKCTQGGTCADGLTCAAEYIYNGNDYGQPMYICDGPLHSPVGGPCRASSSLVAYPEDCVAPATCTTVTSTDCDATSTCQKTICAL